MSLNDVFLNSLVLVKQCKYSENIYTAESFSVSRKKFTGSKKKGIKIKYTMGVLKWRSSVVLSSYCSGWGPTKVCFLAHTSGCLSTAYNSGFGGSSALWDLHAIGYTKTHEAPDTYP